MLTYKRLAVTEQDAELGDEIRPGRYYLLLRIDTLRDRQTYRLSRTPGETNLSHEPRLHGWLGTTNDISWHAQGCVEVYRNLAGHLRIRKCAGIDPGDVIR